MSDVESARNCVRHGPLTKEQIYIRTRGKKVSHECRQCLRAASLRRIPKPCAIHGPNPPDGWLKTAECRTCRNEYLRKYRRERPEQCTAYEGNRDPEKRKAQHRKSHHKRRDKILPRLRARGIRVKIAVLAHYSGGSMRCASCPESRPYALAIDHVQERGEQHAWWGASRLYGWLVKNGYPEGYQILCHNCNSLKSWPKRTSRSRNSSRKAEALLKEEVVFHYSGGSRKCAICGRDNIHVLTLDHLGQDGATHRRSLKVTGGVQLYWKLRQAGFPPGYRILCFSCNLADYLEKKAAC